MKTNRKLLNLNNGSMRISLPMEFLRTLEWNGGDDLTLELVDGKIVISKEEN